MTDWTILDTSWLLELYQVPRDSKKARHEIASGAGYSLADISIVDLARRLQKRKQTVWVLAFDKQLEAYSG